ncbi:hypothetical protein FB451DRAFT_1378428 [Mycena latifolia]|nr:hypothetical protein FB451DRAFT_1378428 [Mycena latifolia]
MNRAWSGETARGEEMKHAAGRKEEKQLRGAESRMGCGEWEKTQNAEHRTQRRAGCASREGTGRTSLTVPQLGASSGAEDTWRAGSARGGAVLRGKLRSGESYRHRRTEDAAPRAERDARRKTEHREVGKDKTRRAGGYDAGGARIPGRRAQEGRRPGSGRAAARAEQHRTARASAAVQTTTPRRRTVKITARRARRQHDARAWLPGRKRGAESGRRKGKRIEGQRADAGRSAGAYLWTPHGSSATIRLCRRDGRAYSDARRASKGEQRKGRLRRGEGRAPQSRPRKEEEKRGRREARTKLACSRGIGMPKARRDSRHRRAGVACIRRAPAPHSRPREGEENREERRKDHAVEPQARLRDVGDAEGEEGRGRGVGEEELEEREGAVERVEEGVGLGCVRGEADAPEKAVEGVSGEESSARSTTVTMNAAPHLSTPAKEKNKAQTHGTPPPSTAAAHAPPACPFPTPATTRVPRGLHARGDEVRCESDVGEMCEEDVGDGGDAEREGGAEGAGRVEREEEVHGGEYGRGEEGRGDEGSAWVEGPGGDACAAQESSVLRTQPRSAAPASYAGERQRKRALRLPHPLPCSGGGVPTLLRARRGASGTLRGLFLVERAKALAMQDALGEVIRSVLTG